MYLRLLLYMYPILNPLMHGRYTFKNAGQIHIEIFFFIACGVKKM